MRFCKLRAANRTDHCKVTMRLHLAVYQRLGQEMIPRMRVIYASPFLPHVASTRSFGTTATMLSSSSRATEKSGGKPSRLSFRESVTRRRGSSAGLNTSSGTNGGSTSTQDREGEEKESRRSSSSPTAPGNKGDQLESELTRVKDVVESVTGRKFMSREVLASEHRRGQSFSAFLRVALGIVLFSLCVVGPVLCVFFRKQYKDDVEQLDLRRIKRRKEERKQLEDQVFTVGIIAPEVDDDNDNNTTHKSSSSAQEDTKSSAWTWFGMTETGQLKKEKLAYDASIDESRVPLSERRGSSIFV